MRIGILALQGDFSEHVAMLRKLGVEAVEVRLPEHLHNLAGVIIPGGESTTIGKLLVAYNLLNPLREVVRGGLATWGTCAGMIVLAKEASNSARPQQLLELMNVKVRRNAFGSQVDSFEADLRIPALGEKSFPGIFIRAPFVESVGPEVETLGKLDDGTIIAARERNMLATAFHPELSGDDRFHRYFLTMVNK